MILTMALVFGGKANNICKEAQIVHRKFGHLRILLYLCIQKERSLDL